MNAEPNADLAELSSYDLFYVHFDERHCSATLGFTDQAGHEAFEFFLVFAEVRNVTVGGWAAPGRKNVQLRRTDDGIMMSVEAEGSALSFRAADMSVQRARSFRAWPQEG